jgi:hypothetical protein
MHPTWNPPAGAEAIDSIFALYDGEKTVSERHSYKARALKPEEDLMHDEDASLDTDFND